MTLLVDCFDDKVALYTLPTECVMAMNLISELSRTDVACE